MTCPPTSRPGRRVTTIGPLASLGVGLALTIGLSCAAAADPAATTAQSAVELVAVADRRAPADSATLALWPPDPISSPSSVTDAPRADRPEQRSLATSSRKTPSPVRVVDASSPPHRGPNHDGRRPERLRADSIDVDVAVEPTGVAQDGTMALPKTVHRAGWYRFSSTPGEAVGTTVIAAHVDTRSQGIGPFVRLRELADDDVVTIVSRDGTQHRYRVLKVRLMPRSRLPVDTVFDRAGGHRLVLVTCGGRYDARSGYSDNVVVLATPES